MIKKKIHNLDMLENQILRNRLALKEKEKELQQNFNHFTDHFHRYISGSFRSRKSNVFDDFASGIAEKAASKTSELMERLMEKLFKKL